MAYDFAPPRDAGGTTERKLAQVYTYLFQMSGALTKALNALDAKVQETATNTTVQTGVASAETVDTKITGAYNNLRSLIIKNADTVQATMDVMVEEFKGTYLAQSEFGTFQSNLLTTVTNTAEGILLNLGYDSQLEAIDASLAGFASYQTTTQEYIKIGVVRYNDDGTTEAGVVVGKDLSEVAVDGKVLVRSGNMYSCFTADRLSFWKNGVEQAYFSNETLFVNAVVTEKITLGNWEINHTSGLSIKWLG